MPKSATQYGYSLIALALIFLAAPLSAQDATPAKKASPAPAKVTKDSADKKDGAKKDDNATPAAADDQSGGLENIPMEAHQPVKGLKFPSYDANNKLQMMLTSDVATKIDDTHIEMQNMKIDSTDDDGKSFHVELPYSIFEIPTRVLTGDKGVLIKRDDFVITGDAGEFYLKTRFAKVLKNVKMIIYSLPSTTATPTPSPTSKTETPAKS